MQMAQKRKPCMVIGTRTCRCGENEKEGRDIMECVSDHSIVRKLFSDHSWYTISYIQAACFHQAALAAAYKTRLVNNQVEIGQEFGRFPVIGSEKGKAIGLLLTKHIEAAGMAVGAAIKKDTKALKTAEDKLYAQGDKMSVAIATALSMDQEMLKEQFQKHNKHVLNLTIMLLGSKIGTEFIQELDAYQNHMMYLADVLYSAIENVSSE